VSQSRERLLKQFRDLVGVRLERITRSIVELESGANTEAGRRVLRELHGLKGEARMMGFDDINALIHEMEELVRSTEPAHYSLTNESTDALLNAVDAVKALSGAEKVETPPEVAKLVAWLRERTRAEGPTKLGTTSAPGASAPATPAPATPAPATPAPASPSAATPAGAPPRSESVPVPPPRATPPPMLAIPVPPGRGGASSATPVPGTLRVPAVRGAAGPVEPSRPSPMPSAAATAAATFPRLPVATANPPAPTKAQGLLARSQEPRADGAVRIGVASLDLLTSAVTNLTQVARRRELANARRLSLARELSQLARQAEDLGPAAAALVARLGHAKELAAELHREAKLLSNEELRDLGLVAEEVQSLRMLPLSVLFEPYPRMVRDLARELGKEVELVVDGEDTRADRAVVEALREPLLHMVRNALDHGLETRVDRVAAGKHPRGCLTLRASREGNRIILRVEDDGLGLDPAVLRKVAVRRGILDEAAANALTDAAARELIFLSGFTSREVATDLSGRGVGLEAVRSSIQALGGDVSVESAPGWGTIFELRVPVSLTVAPLLFVKAGEETLALSATHVSSALKVEPEHKSEIAGRAALRVDGRVLPFAALSALLGFAPERPAREGDLVLIIKSQGATAALAVDRVLEERVQAILPLKGVLGRYAHLTGATSLADGRLAMVLSAAYLISSAQGAATLRMPRVTPSAPSPRRRHILVVDDSPLTRELISALLDAVGYDTLIAADGAEALQLLGDAPTPVDLVVTDLEMPGLDGLELTRRLKTHPSLGKLPVVILTTRGGEEDRQRGLAAGADGYITKGDLVRQDLVDVVGRLLG
jgi:two-component system sensor histidine kinase and response regulator WspE